MESLKYYRKHEAKSLASFEKEFAVTRSLLADRFDEPTLALIHNETVAAIRAMTPEIPAIDVANKEGRSLLLYFPRFVALWKSLSARGLTVEQYVRLQTHTLYRRLDRFPAFVQESIGELADSRWTMKHETAWAARLDDPEHRRTYPKDFVYRMASAQHVPGIKFKYEITQCPVQILFDEQGVPELKPYCDFRDVLLAKKLVFGYATHHGGEGDDFVCAVMLRDDAECEVPPHLKSALAGLEF